jgi:hypothetical protein
MVSMTREPTKHPSADFAIHTAALTSVFGITFLLPLYSQNALGYTATQARKHRSAGGCRTWRLVPLSHARQTRADHRHEHDITAGSHRCFTYVVFLIAGLMNLARPHT